MASRFQCDAIYIYVFFSPPLEGEGKMLYFLSPADLGQ